MPLDQVTQASLDNGRRHAEKIIQFRKEMRDLRKMALDAHPAPLSLRIEAVGAPGVAAAAPRVMRTAGVLVAEGDSWFDYPFHDVLEELEDRFGYDVDSVAHKGDTVEDMAYGDNQLEEFARHIEKLVARNLTPMAILLSGGGNDVAGTEFRTLLNHVNSSIPGLNSDVLRGVIDVRIREAYVHILNAVTEVCKSVAGGPVPIILHGYDYPVPDGRGFLGGWGPLPGPWLEPGFREKGFADLDQRIQLAHDMMDQFNAMLQGVTTLAPFAHVRYIDLRHTLSTDADYRDWWANELHPTEPGFRLIAEKFNNVLRNLP